MRDKRKEYVARAALDNIKLPDGCDEISFSDFAIKVCPNHAEPIPIGGEDGTVDDWGWQYPTKPDQRFPVCDYYLEIPFSPVSSGRWKEADEKLAWALNRLRLFKAGRLWGSLHRVFDVASPGIKRGLEDISDSLLRRPTNAPSLGFEPSFRHVYDIQQDELERMVKFVEEMKEVARAQFEVALHRLHLSFDRDLAQDQAIDLFVALESLFSDDRDAITYKMALRTAYLLEPESIERKELFQFLKRAYSARSAIIHGGNTSSWLTKKDDTSGQINLDKLEDVVKRVLHQLLQHAQRGLVLTPKNLDDYLFFTDK